FKILFLCLGFFFFLFFMLSVFMFKFLILYKIFLKKILKYFGFFVFCGAHPRGVRQVAPEVFIIFY
ncbi:hypothetical protein ACTHSU_11015, partial [Neisseria sp. P0009.S005]|uniref:hypothetical protein n=1 Tax=Neisseria sp. P0009.S005 TaxID=3436712 RepID=UPI003F80A9C5